MRIAQPGKKFWAFENVVGQITLPLGGLRVKTQNVQTWEKNKTKNTFFYKLENIKISTILIDQ